MATITAYAGAQVLTRVTPPASLFTGAGGYAAAGPPGSAGSTLRLVPGVWQQLWRSAGRRVASGVVASGRLDGTRWRISVQLGAAGDCFLGATFDGHAATQATYCRADLGPARWPRHAAALPDPAAHCIRKRWADRVRGAGQPTDRATWWPGCPTAARSGSGRPKSAGGSTWPSPSRLG